MEIKVPFYNVVNMFLTGLVFAGGLLLIFPELVIKLFSTAAFQGLGFAPELVITVCAFATAYEIGLIINRAGSVIIEPSLKWLKMIPFNDDYVLFNDAKKKYQIMNTLSREYALSRTGIVLFLVLLVLALTASKWKISIACAAIVIVYYLSCRKHSQKIVELMEASDVKKEEKSGDSK